MRPADVVVLSRYPDIFEGFKESIDKQDVGPGEKWCVKDSRTDFRVQGDRWYGFNTLEPFNMARNANHGWRQTSRDILYCGDDVRFIEPDTVKRLQEVAYSDYSIGIVSPLHSWHTANPNATFEETYFVPFVCVYLKRSLLDHVGYLDESFEGYGGEDLEFIIRAKKAGARVGWAPQVHIKHGLGTDYATTFRRELSDAELREQDERNRLYLCQKHGLPVDREAMWEAIKHL